MRSDDEQYSVHHLNGQCMPCGSLPEANAGDPPSSTLELYVSPLNSSETHLQVLRELEGSPDITQRELALRLGVSLGATNYCLKALVEKGWVKMDNFGRSDNKLRYAYLLTPKGLVAKTRLASHFLKRKLREYETLKLEIERLELQNSHPEIMILASCFHWNRKKSEIVNIGIMKNT